MNKHLTTAKNIIAKKLEAMGEKLKASITPENKTKVEEAMAELQSMLAEIEAADQEATLEQIAGIFAQAAEKLATASNATVAAEVASMQASVQSKMLELQAKIESRSTKKKLSAQLDLRKAKNTKNEGFQTFRAATVDVDDYTPEAEVENVEIFHPVYGVVEGFEVSTVSKPTIKVRKLTPDGDAAYVLKHGAAPEIDFVGSQNLIECSTAMAAVENIAEADLEDNPELQNEIQNEAFEKLAEFENAAAIELLDTACSAFSNTAFGTKADADEKTALAAIIDKVKQGIGRRKSEICLALNSSTWAKLNDLRNGNGTPIDINSVVGNVIKIEDNSLEDDNFYCWAKKFAKFRIYKSEKSDWYKGIQVTTAEGAITAVYSEWRTDETSVRVRERIAMYVSDTTPFVKGTISGVVTAITPEP